MFDGRCLIFDVKRKERSRCALCTSTIKHQTSHIRDALTLIELLVVIVILTTLVAGVIPILSPNNDTRKIREASRMLQTYIMKAQSEAARTGRDQGIAFRETSPGSGVALDVFRWEVPPAFAGFSSASRVRIATVNPTILIYGSNGSIGNGGTKFTATYDNAPLYNLHFVLAATPAPALDPYPPRMFRIGDVIEVRGKEFLVIDDSNQNDWPNKLDGGFLQPETSAPMFLRCIWLNEGGGQTLPFPATPVLEPYKFIRQPVTSVEEPLQFPAGIAIDLQGSIAEGAITSGFPTDGSLFQAGGGQNTVGIMFSPSGSISNVFLNSNSLTNVSRIAILLGRVENGGLTNSNEWTITASASNDALAELQNKINWLNLDSRWLFIAPNSGRAIVSENAFVDARAYIGANDIETAEFQIEAAHEFGHTMRSTGAGR